LLHQTLSRALNLSLKTIFRTLAASYTYPQPPITPTETLSALLMALPILLPNLVLLQSRERPPRSHTTPHMMHTCPIPAQWRPSLPSPTGDRPHTSPSHLPNSLPPTPTRHLRTSLNRTRPPLIPYSIRSTQSDICAADTWHPNPLPAPLLPRSASSCPRSSARLRQPAFTPLSCLLAFTHTSPLPPALRTALLLPSPLPRPAPCTVSCLVLSGRSARSCTSPLARGGRKRGKGMPSGHAPPPLPPAPPTVYERKCGVVWADAPR